MSKTTWYLSTILATCAAVLSAAAAERLVPELPEADKRIRVLIDTDAACEIDDLYAIALALLSQEKLQIEGFVGAHFGDSGGPDGIGKSVEAIHTVMRKAGMAGSIPVKAGSNPFRYSKVPEASEGVDFIVERAMASTPEDPLWIVLLGPLTDMASAYLLQPEIVKRVRVFWHGRTQWPVKCWNFNAYNDLKAVRIVFDSPLPLVLFDTGTYLRCPMEESATRMLPHGELGRYLHEFRLTKPAFQAPSKGFYDMGDIAALVDPSLVYSETVDAPGVDWDMDYVHRSEAGQILRIYQIDRDRAFDLLFRKLEAASQRN